MGIFVRIDSRRFFSGAPDSDKNPFASLAPSRFKFINRPFALLTQDAKFAKIPLNWNVTLMKDGIKRMVNNL